MKNNNSKEKLLVHACCAPCLTAVNEKLEPKNRPVVFWFNPNIEPKAEYEKRLSALEAFCKESDLILAIGTTTYEADNAEWQAHINEFAVEPEGGERCRKCIEFRLKRTAVAAKNLKIAFTTTLSISPHKNADMINTIGEIIAEEFGATYMLADFKKENGYLRSIELSKKFGLYRQNYCGCRFSQRIPKTA